MAERVSTLSATRALSEWVWGSNLSVYNDLLFIIIAAMHISCEGSTAEQERQWNSSKPLAKTLALVACLASHFKQKTHANKHKNESPPKMPIYIVANHAAIESRSENSSTLLMQLQLFSNQETFAIKLFLRRVVHFRQLGSQANNKLKRLMTTTTTLVENIF